MRNQLTKLKIFLPLTMILCLIVFFFYYVNVDNTITNIDKIYLQKILSDSRVKDYKKTDNFNEQIRFIKSVQKSVLDSFPNIQGIPFYHTREPRDLYTLHQGSCYDKSRTIEKALRLNGFKTRHIAIYSIAKTHSKLKALISPQIRSHAVSEALTSKGWIIVGSLSNWISLDRHQKIITIEQIQDDAKKHKIEWSKKSYAKMSIIFKQPFTYVIGLYSRTGKLYPPYPTPFPNINWHEFLYNFTI